MTGLTYFAGLAVLMAAIALGQSSTPPPNSDPSNSSQAQSGTQSQSVQSDRTNINRTKPKAREDVGSGSVSDQQSSTPSTTGVAGQENTRPSTSTMGTTGSTPGTSEQAPAKNQGATEPQTSTPTDQQPNSTTSPSTPQAVTYMTPAARAVATHTPDPGTCMNPAMIDNGQNVTAVSSPPRLSPNCE